MPRHIDAEVLIEQIDKKQRNLETNNDTMWEINRKYWKGLAMARSLVNEQPTANVMTREEAGFYIEQARQEVAKEIFEKIEGEITDALNGNYKVLPQFEESEALWNNVNGKINALSGIRYFIDELKKKYTEESSNE